MVSIHFLEGVRNAGSIMHHLKIHTPPMNCSHSLNIKVKICQNGLLEECARWTQILKEGLILQRQSIILVFYQLAEELANFCGTSVLRYTTVESAVLSGTECFSCPNPPSPKFQLSPNFPQGSVLHLFYYPTSKAICPISMSY